jgi:hypothetical protein
MTKYFHELTKEQKLNIYNKRIPWGKTAKQYPQPLWCLHENAICGLFGCDELWEGLIEGKKDCCSCKYCENGENYE